MTTVFTETFDGVANGATITTSNTAYSAITLTNGGTAVGDTGTKHVGTGAGKYTVAGTTQNAYATVSFTSATTRYVRAYFRFDAAPSANTPILAPKLGTSTVGLLTLNTDATVKLQNSSSILVGSKSSAITAGTWFRLELFIDTTATTLTARGFFGANVDGTTPDWTATTASNGAFTGIDTIVCGITTAGASALTLRVDDHKADNATWVGPAVVVNNVTVSGAVATATGSAPAGSAAGTQIAYPVSDVAWTGWTRTPGGASSFSATIADADNTTYDESSTNPQTLAFCSLLGATIDPNIDTGHSLTVTCEFVNGTTGSVQLQLVQGPVNADGSGGTVIGSQTFTISSTWATYTLNITSAAGITDYTALYVRGYVSAA